MEWKIALALFATFMLCDLWYDIRRYFVRGMALIPAIAVSVLCGLPLVSWLPALWRWAV